MTWYHRAACLGHDNRLWFTAPGETTEPGKTICRACPVRAQCLDDVLDWEAGAGVTGRHGVVGGLTPAERATEWHRRTAAGTAPEPATARRQKADAA